MADSRKPERVSHSTKEMTTLVQTKGFLGRVVTKMNASNFFGYAEDEIGD